MRRRRAASIARTLLCRLPPGSHTQTVTLILALLGACATVGVLRSQSASPVVIQGRVVDAATGQGLGNARVWAPSDGLDTPTTMTDAMGDFALTLPGMPQWITVQKTGYGRVQIAPGDLAAGTTAWGATGASAASPPAGPSNPPRETAPRDPARRDRTPRDSAPSDAVPRDRIPRDAVPRDRTLREGPSVDRASSDRASSDRASSDLARADLAPSDRATMAAGGAQGAGLAPVLIALTRGGVILGGVVDDLGEPISGARVVAAPSRGTGGLAGTAVTDDLGRYRIGSLSAGAYVLQLIGRAPQGVIVDGRRSPSLFYPNAGTREDAELVQIGPGDTRGLTDLIVPSGSSSLPPGLPVPPADATLPRTSRISGRVVAAGIGTVSYAQVVLRLIARTPSSPVIARTDGAGRFEFRDLIAGRYAVMAAKRGFEPAPGFGGGVQVEVDADDVRSGVDVAMQALGNLSGRVVDDLGEPLDGATVHAFQVRFRDGLRRLIPVGEGRVTDDVGEYRLFGLRPGRYLVAAASPDVSAASLPGFARTFFPAGTSEDSAIAVAVVGGQTTPGVDVSLARVPTFKVSGRMFDAMAKPTMGGQVTLLPIGDGIVEEPRGASILNDGRFSFANVPAGRYVMQVYRGRIGQSVEGEFGVVDITVLDRDVKDIVVQTVPGSLVTGRIVFRGNGTPPRPGSVEIAAVPATPEYAPSQIASLRIYPDWRFDITVANGARRFLPMRLPDGWVVSDVRVGGVSVTDEPVAIGNATLSRTDVEIELTDRVAGVSGQATFSSAQPVVGARVVLFSTDRRRWYDRSRYVATAVTDASGAFSVKGLPPDSYHAALTTPAIDGDTQAWRDPGVLDALTQSATTVVVRDGQTQTVTLRQR